MRLVLPNRAARAAVATAAIGTAAALALAGPADASAAKPSSPSSSRPGAFPTREAGQPDTYTHNRHSLSLLGGGVKNLAYGGGVNGVGVTIGQPKVYLVFWGTQWGTKGTDANGYTTFSGDPKAEAPRIQAFFKGLGTNNDGWSRVPTQYCEGVSAGATTCPSTAPHVAYPSNGVLSGVIYDNRGAAPSQASQAQLGQEAVWAAGQAGNTTSTSNRNAQYVILSPTGTHPDGFNTLLSNWCAWHDYTGDVGVSSPYGPLAFTNDPYVPDMGSSCGANFVNSSANGGAIDGVTIVFGHEYSETITDQFPAGGWTDKQGSENADKCAWISSGQGASANITLGTGTFPVQSTWSNAFNSGKGGCVLAQ